MNAERGSETRDAGPLAPRPASRAGTFVPLGLLVGITSLLYAPAWQFDRIEYDDPFYLFENPNLNSGITRDTVIWALTSLEGASWRPVANVTPARFHCVRANPGAHHFLSVAVSRDGLAFSPCGGGTEAHAGVRATAAVPAPLRVEPSAGSLIRPGRSPDCSASRRSALLAYARGAPGARYALGVVCSPRAAGQAHVPALPIALLAFDLWPLGA